MPCECFVLATLHPRGENRLLGLLPLAKLMPPRRAGQAHPEPISFNRSIIFPSLTFTCDVKVTNKGTGFAKRTSDGHLTDALTQCATHQNRWCNVSTESVAFSSQAGMGSHNVCLQLWRRRIAWSRHLSTTPVYCLDSSVWPQQHIWESWFML